MAKKLSLLIAAVAVWAIAVPAMASAAPTATAGGTVVKVGETITATGSDVILTAATVGNITCQQINLGAQLTKNNDTEGVAMKSINQFTYNNCTNKNGAVTITTIELTNLVANVSGSVSAFFVSKIDLGTKLTCTFTGTSVPGGYTAGTDTVTFTGATGVNGGACGTATLDGSFTLELGTTPVLIS